MAERPDVETFDWRAITPADSPLGLPDIIEEGRGTFDAVLIWTKGDWRLRFAADNLTNARYEFTQGGLPQVIYSTGRSFKFGIGYRIYN